MSESEFDPLRRFAAVLLQQGRVALDADSNEDTYVHLRRFLVDVAQSVDKKLQWGVFEPSEPSPGPARRPGWPGANEHDPGVTLIELLTYVADRLDAYADEVADEARLSSRPRRAAAIAVLLVLVAWRVKRRR